MEGRQAHLSRPTVWVAIPESGRSLTVQVKALVVDQLGGPIPRKRVWPTQSRLRGCLYLRRYQVCACAPLRSPVSARSRASALGLASAFRRALVKSRSLNRIAALPAQWTELVWPVDRRRRPSKLNAGNDRRGALTLEAGAAALGGLLPIRLPAGMFTRADIHQPAPSQPRCAALLLGAAARPSFNVSDYLYPAGPCS
jgi:hypothetical protein